MTTRPIAIERLIAAPRPIVFRLWTEPAELAAWWGPHGCTTPSVSLDARPGGAWRTCLEAADGRRHWCRGRYAEVTSPERLSFSFAWESGDGRCGDETVVEVDFGEEGADVTRLRFRKGPVDPACAIVLHPDGWIESLQRLEMRAHRAALRAARLPA